MVRLQGVGFGGDDCRGGFASLPFEYLEHSPPALAYLGQAFAFMGHAQDIAGTGMAAGSRRVAPTCRWRDRHDSVAHCQAPGGVTPQNPSQGWHGLLRGIEECDPANNSTRRFHPSGARHA